MDVKILLLLIVYTHHSEASWSFIENAASSAVQHKADAAVRLLESQRSNIYNIAKSTADSVIDHKQRLIENIAATVINAVIGHKRSFIARLTNSTVDALIAHKRAIIRGLGNFASLAIHELLEHKRGLISNLTTEAVNGVINHKGILLQEAGQAFTNLLTSASGGYNSEPATEDQEPTPYAYAENYDSQSDEGSYKPAPQLPNLLAHGASAAVSLAAGSLQGKVDGLQRILETLVYTTDSTPVVQVSHGGHAYPAPLIQKTNQDYDEDDDYDSTNY